MPENIILEVKDTEGNTMELTYGWEASMGDLMNGFRTILYWLGYSITTIEEILGEKE